MEIIIAAAIGAIIGYWLKSIADKLVCKFSDIDGCETKSGNNIKYAIAVICGLFSVFAVYRWGITLAGMAAIVFFCAMIVLTIVDIKIQILPDIITLPLIIIGIIVNIFDTYIDINSSIIGAIVGFSSLWLINFLFRLLRNKNGMGAGDFKLYAAIGAWVGWQQLPMVIMFSSIVGLIVTVIGVIFCKKDIMRRIPFGPYLAASGIISLCYGNEIISWYISLLSL